MAETNGNRASRGNLMKSIGKVISLLQDILTELKKLNSKSQDMVYKDNGLSFSQKELEELRKSVANQQIILNTNENNRRPGNKGYTNKAR